MPNHAHSAGWLALAIAAVALGLYGLAVVVARRRGRSWSAARTSAWVGGVLCCAAATAGPLATAAGVSLTAHMVTHLLLGMLGPLLLVLGAPVKLALRALPVRAARGLTRLLRTWPIRLLTHPVPTAVLTVGGLWVLYATDLFRLTQLFSGWHVIVHLHVVFAGYLFTASLVSPDPAPHRAGLALRSSVLTLSLAGHGILAKYLYVHPPAGFGAVDAERAAMVMFYGGDAVDAVLIVLVCREWYRSTAPRPAVVPLGLAAPAGMHGGRPPLR